MRVSDGEKLIILMLSELYDKLEIRGEIKRIFIRSAIFSDNTWSIPWKYSGIPFENQETPEIVKEVLDILEMWSFIERSYEVLSDDEKNVVRNGADPFGDDPTFPGFDGNNEPNQMGIATFLVNDLDRFQEFKGRYFNSHCPSIDSYRRMLPVFESTRRMNNYNLLSVQQIIDILRERIHPELRK